MKKTLKEVDPVYESVMNYMSKEEQIKYCESLVTETESFLSTSTKPIDDKSKEKYKTLICAAKNELKSLKN
jgi:hypothetical protein